MTPHPADDATIRLALADDGHLARDAPVALACPATNPATNPAALGRAAEARGHMTRPAPP
jgi:hypothetical protein